MEPQDAMNVSPEIDIDRKREEWREAFLVALWESKTAHKAPPGPSRGRLWPWEVVRPLVAETAKLSSPEIVERRVLQFVNPDPASSKDESTVKNMAVAIQMLLPGESARPHRHSMNALRFVLEGEGATTIVDGKPCPMEPGDLILTPAWCWHEHRHDGNKPVMWLDALDVPLHAYMGTAQFEAGPIKEAPETLPDDAFMHPNILPAESGTRHDYSPVFRYPYKEAVAALANAPLGPDGAKWVRYVNPLTAGAPMSTMDCRLMGVDAQQVTRAYRSNANAFCLVLDGTGQTDVGDDTHCWKPKDIFTIPQGNWVVHRTTDEGARMLVVSDREVMRRIGLFEEEYRTG